VTLVCRDRNAALINAQGVVVRMPAKGRDGLVELRSRELAGTVAATTPQAANPADNDLVVLAMQEPQYRSPGVRELLEAAAKSRVPCMSIMNMPPPPYLARIDGVDLRPCDESYTDSSLWESFDPALVTLCSPDPQAVRPPDGPGNVLEVRLPTNFKVARFTSDAHTALLRELGEGIEAARLEVGGEAIDLPVKLKVHDSIFVPLAKWAMLLAGNYRCVLDDGVRSIRDAVHGEVDAARSVYEWVVELCVSLGASLSDMVPFPKYALAAESRRGPTCGARARAPGAARSERVDRLVQAVAAQKGMRNAAVDETVARIDAWLVRNRLKG
jgi:hypothetical protein